jgi:Domain of unknown function (DUF4307)
MAERDARATSGRQVNDMSSTSAGISPAGSPDSSGSPDGSATPDVRARLDERYGRRRPRPGRRRLLVAVLAVVAVAVAAWVVWAALGVARSSLTWQDGAVDAADPAAVRVSFVVRGAAGAHVVCTLRATDAAGAVVGWLDVPVALPSSGRATVTAVVPTSQPAIGGGVGACAPR